MAFKWTMRLARAGTLLGAGYLAVGYIDSARGTVGENERPETVVQAAAASQHEEPLELMPSEIAAIQPSSMVERLRVSGELEPITLHAKDGGRILEIRAREGHAVEAGVVLLRFDTRNFNQSSSSGRGIETLQRRSCSLSGNPSTGPNNPPAFSNSANKFGADTNRNHQLRQEHDL